MNTGTSSGLEWPSDLSREAEAVRAYIGSLLKTAFQPAETLYQASQYLFQAGGKMLRPYLALKACEAVGGESSKAIPAAAALEILHTFTLIHDDIIDRDMVRRGVPSVHVKWDEPTAILAGDFLFAKVFQAASQGLRLKGVAESTIVRVVETLAQTTLKICEGQMLDMEFEGRSQVSEEEYLAMVERKTAYLFKASAEVGALVGSASQTFLEALSEYGRLAGIGFQMVDDALGLTADEAKLGKPVGSDLREGKKTMPIIYALSKADPQQREIILKASTSKTLLNHALNLIVKLGAIEYTKQKAKAYVEQALTKLQILPETPARRKLEVLARLLVEREF